MSSIGRTDSLESSLACESDLADRLEVGLGVGHPWDEACDLPQSIALSRPGLERVGRRQGAVFERRLFGLRLRPDEFSDVGYAAGRESARAFPQGRTVTAGLVLTGRVAEVTERASIYVTSIDQRFEGKIAVHVELDGDLLADEARFFAAAEDEHFDPGSAAAPLEFEAAYQFPCREIVSLIDHRDCVRSVGQPYPCELNVARDRVRRDRDRLD